MLFRTCGKSYEKIDTSVEIIKHVKFTFGFENGIKI